MKKMLIVSLALGLGILFTSSAEAYKEPVREDTGSYSHRLSLQKKLNDALQMRWSFLNKKHNERNVDQKTVPYQQRMHLNSRKATNTSEVSTRMKRTGAMTDYTNLKPVEDRNYFRPNRKAVFKSRAIDYYVDGGDAGKEAMESNVIFGSTHKIDTNKYYNTYWKKDFESIRKIRNVQRAFYSPANAKSGTQKLYSQRKGSYQRNLIHPFVSDELEGFFSTEAE
jgi:hypothetical protein